jgi:hypothetical protein
LGLVLLGLLAGGVLAWWNRPAPLLVVSNTNAPKIPRQDTVQEQYSYAQFAQHNKEEALLAVEKYFPPNQNAANLRYSRLAKRELGNFYLSNQRLDEALKLYDQLESVEEAEVNFKLSGTAGVAVVNHRFSQQDLDQASAQRRQEEVIKRLVKLRPHEMELDLRLGGLLAGEVRKLFDEYEPAGS